MAEEACNSRSVTLEDISSTSQYFTSLIDLIPTKFYVHEPSENQNGYQNGKKKKLTKHDKKLLSKKAKMLRLDPAQHKTVNELQLEIEKKELEKMEEEALSERIKPIKVSEIQSVPLDELREKLHAKLDQLRGGKRKITTEDDRESLKRSRLEKKTKSKKKKDDDKLSAKIKTVTEIEEQSMPKKQHSIKNDQGDLVFSKFDFASGNPNSKKKSLNTEKLLKKAEKSMEKIEKLEKEDSAKAQQLKESMAWDKAIKKAEGEKLKDDPKLLKKTLKSREKRKTQSKKKWEDRVKTVENQKQEKQTKRKENIKERRQDKINKKIGKGKKDKTTKKKKSKPGF